MQETIDDAQLCVGKQTAISGVDSWTKTVVNGQKRRRSFRCFPAWSGRRNELMASKDETLGPYPTFCRSRRMLAGQITREPSSCVIAHSAARAFSYPNFASAP